MNLNKILSLDLGTTKFCLSGIKQETSDSLPKLKVASVPAQGMYRGMLSDLEKAKKALTGLIELAEKKLGLDVYEVVVGVAGSHLKSENFSAEIYNPHPSVITRKTLKILEEKARLKGLDEDKEFLHLIPVSYTIDERTTTKKPEGFTFRKLRCHFFAIQADKLYLLNIIKLCNDAGLKIKNLYAEPFASAAVILNQNAKDHGIIIADIGGGTTDGIIFKAGEPISIFTVNIGGKITTNDISIGLGIPFSSAEKIKKSFGLVSKINHPPVSVLDVYDKVKKIDPRNVNKILKARVQELAYLIKKETAKHSFSARGGLVLTGGGSEISGLSEFMEKLLLFKVQKVTPSIPTKLYENVCYTSNSYETEHYETKYATSLGLLYLEALNQEKTKTEKNTNKISTLLKSFVGWIRELS